MNEETRCVIVGAGPGGSMLALPLARRGVPVTLLEMHKDFDREFRGDTVHPSTLEILEEKQLAEVQHRREFPTRFIQRFQAMMQKRLLAPALASTQTSLQVPTLFRWFVRVPMLRDLPPRLIGLGVQRGRVDG
jgi:2-polyprenyl-6-methoxyphenol hydroxylase-like FAD-dependent oxidoreductase